MDTAFQADAFQNDAFQIVAAVAPVARPGVRRWMGPARVTRAIPRVAVSGVLLAPPARLEGRLSVWESEDWVIDDALRIE